MRAARRATKASVHSASDAGFEALQLSDVVLQRSATTQGIERVQPPFVARVVFGRFSRDIFVAATDCVDHGGDVLAFARGWGDGARVRDYFDQASGVW